MHAFVEYIDEKTGKPTGQYAKRHHIPVEVEEEIEILKEVEVDDPVTGKLVRMFIPFKEIRKIKKIEFKDEVIPIKRFCICDAAGNLKSITEVRFSKAIEEDGKDHCMELSEDEECHRIDDATWAECVNKCQKAGIEDGQHLNHILDNHEMGSKDKNGKRIMKDKT